ncbi:small integral membrane protein 26 [Antechinus flavipes]|uniref:small integral membrane protein 26 n=1 Tax=Antechinus flavipes TaxID=38775 RepID=UPI0022366D82|nr:small integral membrane protein 26 [Antechinus flavipes]
MRECVPSLWYRRMSLIYALGAWTLVGSICISSWKRKQTLANEEVLKDEDSVEKAESRRGFYVETVVTYKENFVPFSTRFYNYWKSWSNGPGPSE